MIPLAFEMRKGKSLVSKMVTPFCQQSPAAECKPRAGIALGAHHSSPVADWRAQPCGSIGNELLKPAAANRRIAQVSSGLFYASENCSYTGINAKVWGECRCPDLIRRDSSSHILPTILSISSTSGFC